MEDAGGWYIYLRGLDRGEFWTACAARVPGQAHGQLHTEVGAATDRAQLLAAAANWSAPDAVARFAHQAEPEETLEQALEGEHGKRWPRMAKDGATHGVQITLGASET